MRVDTRQETGFIDELLIVPDSELSVIDELINWRELEPYFYKVAGDYSGLSLFKVLLLQSWFNLSDMSIATALTRDIVFIRFCRFSIDGNKPDASTICRFRHRLVKSGKLDRLLRMINQQLESRDLKVADGKYVSCDATLISSSRRPRKHFESEQTDTNCYEAEDVVYSDDSDASWKRKGQQSVYGYAGYVTTDEDGLVEAVSTRGANESEMTVFPDILDEACIAEGKTVLYDKGVTSKANQDALSNRKLGDGIMRKKPKGKPMSYWNKVRNRLIGKRRFVTERTFGTLKRVYGLNRARYLGLAKVNAEIIVKSIAYNLKRAKTAWLSMQESCAQNKEIA